MPPAHSVPPRPPRQERLVAAFGAVIIVLAGWAAYRNSSDVPFLYDDPGRDRPKCVHPSPGFQSESAWWRGATVMGRPILNLSFAFNYAWGGTAVAGYHFANLAIHLLAGLTLFGIVRRTLERFRAGLHPIWVALAVALIWTLHPLQTEAVTYVAQRAESLMGLFYLLTVYSFVRWAGGSRTQPIWAVLAIVCCLLGMGTKEVMVSAPLIVLLYDATFLTGSIRAAVRRRWPIYVGLAATWIPLAALVIGAAGRGGTAGFGSGVSWWRYALTQFPAVIKYLELALWPRPLVFDYGTQWVTRPWSVLPAALGVMALIMLAACAWFWPVQPGRTGLRRLGFAGAWYFAILAPTSLVPGVRQTMAEHRMYLALVPVVIIAVLAADAGLRLMAGWGGQLANWPTPSTREASVRLTCGALVLAVVVSALGRETWRRNADYRSDLALWSDTVAKMPNNPYARDALGAALLSRGRTAEALAEYRTALRLMPQFADTHNNLATALAKSPEGIPEAIGEFETALRIKPNSAEIHYNLATVLANQPARLIEAVDHYEAALRINPHYAEAENNLASTLARMPGREPEAVAHYQQALLLNPNGAQIHHNLAKALAKIPGRLPEALDQDEIALRLSPPDAEAQNNLAVAYARVGLYDKAAGHFKRALELNPGLSQARFNLTKLRAHADN